LRQRARYNPFVDIRALSALPGADLVLKGIRDLESGAESVEALLVQVGAPRLRSLGIDVRSGGAATSPEHRLYARLSADEAGSAHGRYNALLRKLVSFERALACASR
jgi:hypothetical protein